MVCCLLLLFTLLTLIAAHVLANVDHWRLFLLYDNSVIGAGGLSWVQLARVQAYISIHLVPVLGMLWFMDISGILSHCVVPLLWVQAVASMPTSTGCPNKNAPPPYGVLSLFL